MSTLIEADELAILLRSPEVVVADVRWAVGGPYGLPVYEAAHVPGAHWVDLDTDLAGPPGPLGRHPLPEADVFEAAMRRIGVGPDTLVVAMDAGSALGPGRLWWLLRDAGHERVRVLNGGFAAWLAGGWPTESGPDRLPPPGTFMARPGQLPQADAAVAAEAGRTHARLVDVRAPERYRGEHEPIDPVAGHIPGAVNVPAAEMLAADGRFRPAADLAAALNEVAAAPVVYCGSGVTASQALLALEIAGRHDGVLYPGSWSEWITDPERPVATGQG